MNDDRQAVLDAPQPALLSKNGHSGEPKEKKVFVASPIYGHVDTLFFQCCMRLQQEFLLKKIHGVFQHHFGDSAVGRARNNLTRQFLQSDCTHLLFVDSDLVFGCDQIERMLTHDLPIVGGLYVKKQEGPPQFVINGTFEPSQPRPDHLMEVRYVGTGFIMVAREVFEKMIEVYGEQISYRLDYDAGITEWDFWTMGVYKYPDGNKRWLSEDWYFCQRALDLGYKVYVDMAVLLKHSGYVTFPLTYQEKEIYKKDTVTDDFNCPDDCQSTIKEVFGGEYEFGISFQNPPRVLDIGANVGAFAWWADFKWPGANITCYEPNPETFSYLEGNCAKINAKAINSAVGNTEHNRLFKGSTTRLTCSQYRTDGLQLKENMPIKVIHPSEIGDGYDLIKIDVEGAELDIVEGLNVLPTYILVEYHSKENKQRLLTVMAGKMLMLGDRAHDRENGVIAFRKLAL
jgi:FkbM family methyltransferase